MSKAILIIGGTGMLGEPVARRMNGDGFHVTVMSTNPERAKNLLGDDFKIIKGDVRDLDSLKFAIEGKDFVYINLNSGLDPMRYEEVEIAGTENVARVSSEMGIRRIANISSATSTGKETGIIYVDAKVRAERALMECGVPYTIMRPSWFFETLPKFIKGNSARIIGRQPFPRRWLSADDYARQVSSAFQTDIAANKCFYNYGPEEMTISEALRKYCKQFGLNAEISSVSYARARLASLFPAGAGLRLSIPFFKFFESFLENQSADNADRILGANRTTLEHWAKAK